MTYRKSTYWHDMYKKIQKDTHWTSEQMHVMVPDVCKLKQEEVMSNIGSDSKLLINKTTKLVECPCCGHSSSVGSWWSKSNDYNAICPICDNVIQYDELPIHHAERIKDS